MKPQPTKTVTFDPMVTGVQIMSTYDYSPKEIAATWYNDEEMDQIAIRCFKVISKSEAGVFLKGKKRYCTRGLECYFSVASLITKQKTRSTAIAAVLVQQSRQWVENKVDDQAIADAYRKTTASCQIWAQVVGERDQQAAQ